MEVSLFSSANDVWGAITAATAVYPKAMRNLYQQISVVSGDGYTVGSIRTITFGHGTYPVALACMHVYSNTAKSVYTELVYFICMLDYQRPIG
ncbi:MLP-like protein 423 [Linum perenne]